MKFIHVLSEKLEVKGEEQEEGILGRLISSLLNCLSLLPFPVFRFSLF